MRSQKQLVLEIIRTSPEHLTADQIYLGAKKEHSSVAMGTVYRNLQLLTEEGVIRRVEIPGEPVHYDKNTRPHEHKICTRCGRVEDIALRGDLLGWLRGQTGEEVESYQLSIHYICPACRAAADRA